MADNTQLNVMSGGDVVRAVDRAGVKTQAFIQDRSGGATPNLGVTGSKTQTTAAPTDAAASQVLAANATRKSALIYNNSSGIVYVGPSGVLTTTGIPLAAGQSITDTTSVDAWFAICATGVVGDLRITEVA